MKYIIGFLFILHLEMQVYRQVVDNLNKQKNKIIVPLNGHKSLLIEDVFITTKVYISNLS